MNILYQSLHIFYDIAFNTLLDKIIFEIITVLSDGTSLLAHNKRPKQIIKPFVKTISEKSINF